jgi:hypothetical protein
MVPVPQQPQIDGPGTGVQNQIEDPVCIPRYGNGFYEITPRTHGYEGKEGILPKRTALLHETVDNFVERSVTSDTNHDLGAFQEGPASEVYSVSRSGSLQGLK